MEGGPKHPLRGFAPQPWDLSPGRHDVAQLTLGNDVLSSLRVPPGLRVTIFSESRFWGDKRTFTTDVAYVGDVLNDRTSSIVVEKTT